MPHVPPDTDQMAEELALLGHDLRSAVADVIAGLSLIDDSPLATADRVQLERAKATTESLVRYLEEGLTTLLAQATPKPDRSLIDLDRLLRDVKRRWGHAGEQTGGVIVTSVNLPTRVQCNHTALDRILSNLISNAITYSGGQTIRLDVTHPDQTSLRFTITDQGPGFPPHISTAPRTGSALPAWHTREGHGLGLGIAQTLAQRIGASLTLHNNPGGGGVATLLVPITVADATNTTAIDTSCLHGKKVLIADDSMPQLLLLSKLLRDNGAETTMVRDGHAATRALENGAFDLALLDLEMPGRTGLEICEALRDQAKCAPRIVILTAHSLPAVHQSALTAGAAQVLVKPITSSLALAEALCGDPPIPTTETPSDFTRLLDMAGPDLAAELLARYHDDLTAIQTTLTTALKHFDWQNLRAASHVLIALAGTAGMARLEQVARAFNLAANQNNSAALQSHQAAILGGLTDLIRYIQGVSQERQG